jgi:hypothetical protein
MAEITRARAATVSSSDNKSPTTDSRRIQAVLASMTLEEIRALVREMQAELTHTNPCTEQN